MKNNEFVNCMFSGCSYKTNHYGAFNTHKWRKHTPHTLNDRKPGIVDGYDVVESFETGTTDQLNDDLPSEELPDEESTVSTDIELKLASVLLQLEH